MAESAARLTSVLPFVAVVATAGGSLVEHARCHAQTAPVRPIHVLGAPCGAHTPLILQTESAGELIQTGVLLHLTRGVEASLDTPEASLDTRAASASRSPSEVGDVCEAVVELPADWRASVHVSVPTTGAGWQAVSGIVDPRLWGVTDSEDRVALAPGSNASWDVASLAPQCFDFHGASACVIEPRAVGGGAERGMVVVLPPATYGADPRLWWYWVDVDELSRQNVVVLLAPPRGRDPMVFSDHHGGETWGDWIEEELIPRVQANWRTSADRTHRVVMGFSTGGLGALLLGLLHPEAFGTVVAASPDAPMLADWLLEARARPRDHVRQVWVERARLEALLGERAEFASYAELYGAEWPFELGHGLGGGGGLIEDRWKAWNRGSPLGVLSRSRHRNALRGGRVRFVLTAGLNDESGLFEPSARFAEALRSSGLEVCWSPHARGHVVPDRLWGEVARWAHEGPPRERCSWSP
jgi:pimeloyl-ACP methyl ester carboxylesterase